MPRIGNLPPQTHINLPRFDPPPGLGLPSRFRPDPTTGRAVVYTNGIEVSQWLLSRAGLAELDAIAITRHYAMLLTVRTQANASGRPGPNIDTGAYVASWSWRLMPSVAGVVTAVIGSDAPQARRLEFGFVGEDALGRVYDQPPYPHLMPAWRDTVPEYIAALGGVGRIIR